MEIIAKTPQEVKQKLTTFVKYNAELKKELGLKTSEIIVLGIIESFTKTQGSAKCKMTWLAETAGFSRMQVYRCIERLKELNLIEIKK